MSVSALSVNKAIYSILGRTIQCQKRNELLISSINNTGIRCFHCHHRQRIGVKTTHSRTLKRNVFHSWQGSVRFLSSVPKDKPQGQVMSEDACPQGIQGDIDADSQTYNLWLNTCKKYGLANCDQQLQGIQSGRKTIAQVLAEQDALIQDIAEQYRQKNVLNMSTGRVAVGEDGVVLPDINTPCPQGIQGEDCARFKMWLENCHRFQFENCSNQLESYNKGHKTLAQIFEEQDTLIREAAMQIQANKAGGSASSHVTNEKPEELSTKPLSAGQKLKNAVAVYGSTVMVFHISISLASLGFFYTLVSSGIDIVGLLGRLGIGESILQSKLATGTGTFVVAYAVHKVFAPARIAATLTATPLIVRYLRQIGFLKTPPKKH